MFIIAIIILSFILTTICANFAPQTKGFNDQVF
jgi:hypothetical protein